MSESKILIIASAAMVALSVLTALGLIAIGASPAVIVLASSIVGISAYVGTFFVSKPYKKMTNASFSEDGEPV